MKALKLVIVTTCFVSLLQAQVAEKLFVPYYVNQGAVENFERVAAKMEAKSIGFGYGGANQYLTVFEGRASPLRFKANEMPKFIIKVDEGTDVLDLVVLSKADEVKKSKKYRRFVQKGFSFGGGAKDISKYTVVPKLKRLDDDVYEMVFAENLQPGEYSFLPILKGDEAANVQTTSGDFKIYCFGVD